MIMQHFLIALYLCGIAALLSSCAGTGGVHPGVTAPPPGETVGPAPRPGQTVLSYTEEELQVLGNTFAYNVLKRLNDLRRDRNVQPLLRWHRHLEEAAVGHTQEMARNNHLNWVANDGTTVEDRAIAAGYPLGSQLLDGFIGVGYFSGPDFIDSMMRIYPIDNPFVAARFVHVGAARVGTRWTILLAFPSTNNKTMVFEWDDDVDSPVFQGSF
ncbi:MAG: CAP domain-containing protein [Planctomycetota bacterium]|nr:MAG: CAP domain-containing protein [Planctomycetota bacterium]